VKLNFDQAEEPIISAKKTLRKIGCSTDELAIAARETNAALIVIPPTPFHIGIRFPKGYRRGIFDRAGENPLSIDIQEADGFSLPFADNDKVLHSLNWKTAKPLKIALTNPKNNSVTLHTPHSLSLQTSLHDGRCSLYCLCGIDDKRSAYRNQEFFFQNKTLSSTKITLDCCYFLQSDLEKISSYIYKSKFPSFNDVGDYQINVWSNSFIMDINAIYHYLKRNRKIQNTNSKTTISDNHQIIKCWFAERWARKKGVTKACLEQIHKIVGNENLGINLESLGVSNEEINRNQRGATDILILIDIAAERRNKKRQNYLGSQKFHDELIEAGVEPGELRQAIYSIIKAK